MKVRSPAFMVLTVTRRASDRRMAPPSGIAAGGVDVVGRAFRDAIDRNVDRPVETDDENGAGRRHLGGDVLPELDHETGKAAAGRESRLTPDSVGRPDRRREADQQAGCQ
ncbi:hypothetical protein ACVWZK_004339 [Bradyrhizobium sp. GM0.4]